MNQQNQGGQQGGQQAPPKPGPGTPKPGPEGPKPGGQQGDQRKGGQQNR